MTFMHVTETAVVAENRSWLPSPHGSEVNANPNITLLLSLFNQASHYPNGYLPSGIVVGQVTATKLWGPYDPAATDGRETAKGLLFGSLPVKAGQKRTAGALVWHGVVDPTRLPIESGTGSLDTAARGDLPAIHFLNN